MRTFANAHDRRCQAPGCTNKIWAKDFCQRHYNRDYYRRAGNAVSNRHEGVVRVGVPGWGSL